MLGLLVHMQREYVWARVMSYNIKVELAACDLDEVEIGVKNPLLIVQRSGKNLPQR